MTLRRVLAFLAALLFCGSVFAAESRDIVIGATKPGSKVTIDKILADGKALVSVFDEGKKPVLGLTYKEFTVSLPGKTAEVVSLEPITETILVPRHMVLVLDNSYSMVERQAVNALLRGVDELLKTVRPIDDVRVVVFNEKTTEKIAGRDLKVSTFKSNDPKALKDFVSKAYSSGLSASTVLFDAMVAGFEQLKDMPANEPRFVVIFSDGEDINSSVKAEDAAKASGESEKYKIYAIDYMPGPDINALLTEVAAKTQGQAWKATSDSNIVEIFQKVAITFDYYYVVNYRFPPAGTLTAAPEGLTVSAVRAPGVAGDAGLIHTGIDGTTLTVGTTIDSEHGISGWKMTVDNAGGNLAKASGEGAPAPEFKVDFPAGDLKTLVAGGDIIVKMELTDKKEQLLSLTAKAVKMKVAETEASIAVSPLVLNIAEVAATASGPGGLKTGIDQSVLTAALTLPSKGWVAKWKATATNAKGNLANLSGEGAPGAEVKVALPTGDLDALAEGGDISLKLDLSDAKGKTLELAPGKVKVGVVRSVASLAASPASLNIDEVRTGLEGDASGALRVSIDQSVLTLRPTLGPTAWVARWKATVSNAKGELAFHTAEGAVPAETKIALPTGDLQALGTGGDLTVKLELFDAKQKGIVLVSQPLKVNLAQTNARLTVAPDSLKIDEIKIIDSSPMLAHVYFDRGSSDIPAKYKLLASPAETTGFNEQNFRDTLEKYYHVLNIIGKRLVADPAAKITIVGCNDQSGGDKGKKNISGKRAETVRNYLQTIWGIAPERMTLEARGLPAMPSNTSTEVGQAENRRVEIVSTVPAITAPIQSTYTNVKIDVPALTLTPQVVAAHGVDRWRITLVNTSGVLSEMSGTGAPAAESKIQLDTMDLQKLAYGGDLKVAMEVFDAKGQRMELTPAPVKLVFAQKSLQLSERTDPQRVQEKYALVLFDFDKDTVGPSNQEIVNGIAARIKALPDASVEIVGHTDNIGKEEYNLKLSERRANAVYANIAAALGEAAGGRIKHLGVGPNNPLYDNLTPEARGFNRTVTILIDYLSAE